MRGKVLIKKIMQKQYKPIVWVKDDTESSGKRQLDEEAQSTREDAEEVIEQRALEHDVFFSDIKEVTREVKGEFYIDRGYYS